MKFVRKNNGDFYNKKKDLVLCRRGVMLAFYLPKDCTEFWVRFRKEPHAEGYQIHLADDGLGVEGYILPFSLGILERWELGRRYIAGWRYVTLEVLA